METIEDIVRAMRDFENLAEDGYDQYEAYRMLCWFADRIEKAADAMEREKRYEYAVRFNESGNLYARSSDYAYAKRVMDNVCADGLIVCHIVRREVGELEEVEL